MFPHSIIVIIYIDLIIECCWLKLLFIGHLQSTCSNNDLIGWETPLLQDNLLIASQQHE